MSPEAAAARAKQLFLSSLRPQERQQWERFGYFTITGSDGLQYVIRKFGAYNVMTQRGERFCAYPPGVPSWDCLLAQKLLIETDAPAFRRVAFLQRPW